MARFHAQRYYLSGVDDVWVAAGLPAGQAGGELIIVDYKATSKDGEVSLDAEWQDGYKRQMEVYQWLFRKNGFKVSPTGYFVYCNGVTDTDMLDGKLKFTIKLIPYIGNDFWVEGTIKDLHKCLCGDTILIPGEDCDYCKYVEAVNNV